MIDEIVKFLESHSLSFKKYTDGDSNIQLNCPLCSDTKGRLGIRTTKSSKKGEDYYWKCFNCNATSRSLSFLGKSINNVKKNGKLEVVEKKKKKVDLNPELAEKMHEALKKEENKDIVKYLILERGLNKDAIKYFKLGTRSKFKNKEGDTYSTYKHLAIPYFDDGVFVNVKYRNLDPDRKKSTPKWRREEGGETILFNKDVLHDHSYDSIYIAEAEIDAMTLWCHGIKNVVGLSAGATGFQQEWRDLLQRFNKIYLVLDNDEAGQAGAYDIAKMLGLNKCINILLPDNVKDINEFFKENSLDDFRNIVKKSTQFSVPDVVDLRYLLRSAITELKVGKKIERGLDTEWSKVNDILGPVMPGNLIVWAARPKCGKTTMVMQWLYYLAKKHDICSFNYQCEMEEEDMLDKYIRPNYPSHYVKMPPTKYDENGQIIFKNNAEKLEYDEIKEKREAILRWSAFNLPIDLLKSYHPKSQFELTISKVCDKIKQTVQRFDCKIVVFDNLHFLCRGKDSTQKIEEATQAFKMLARELGVVLVLVTHPRKTNNNKELDNDDLKDSGAIFQDADAVVLMHREALKEKADGSEDEENPVLDNATLIKVTARRHQGGRTTIAFDPNNIKFVDHGDAYDRVMKDY